MENVWECLRASKLCGRVWDTRVWHTYDAIVHACKAAWEFLVSDPVRIRSTGQREWACVNS